MNTRNISSTSQFKGTALDSDSLRSRAPSIFASGPMTGVSGRYTFVPTARIVEGLRELDWVPVEVEEQRIRTELRRGYQKHLIRFRQTSQMQTLDEWNVELVLLNSHDGGCAYQLHAGIYRRICSNGLVVADGSFETIRFRHAGLDPDVVVQSSLRLMEFLPQLAQRVEQMRERMLEPVESLDLAEHALLLRYATVNESPIHPGTLLTARRVEDQGVDLWTTTNRVQENLIRGGVADGRRDSRGVLRTVRALRGIDSKVTINKGLWGIAERLLGGETQPVRETVSLPV